MLDFPGGPVFKNLPAYAGDTSLIPASGRFHMLFLPLPVPNSLLFMKLSPLPEALSLLVLYPQNLRFFGFPKFLSLYLQLKESPSAPGTVA